MKRPLFLFVALALFALRGASSLAAEPLIREAQTLLGMGGARPEATRLSESVLLIIDAQREYLDGKLRLAGIDASLKEASLMLERTRKSGTPVIHVMHQGRPGSALFNPDGPYLEIVGVLAPKANEAVVVKTLPNAFAGTNLEEQLSRIGRKNLIVIGYMTHMCVSSTVRAALDRGYRTTIVAKATATRDLPGTAGEGIPAPVMQRASLAALADRFAVVVQNAQDIPE